MMMAHWYAVQAGHVSCCNHRSPRPTEAAGRTSCPPTRAWSGRAAHGPARPSPAACAGCWARGPPWAGTCSRAAPPPPAPSAAVAEQRGTEPEGGAWGHGGFGGVLRKSQARRTHNWMGNLPQAARGGGPKREGEDGTQSRGRRCHRHTGNSSMPFWGSASLAHHTTLSLPSPCPPARPPKRDSATTRTSSHRRCTRSLCGWLSWWMRIILDATQGGGGAKRGLATGDDGRPWSFVVCPNDVPCRQPATALTGRWAACAPQSPGCAG